MTGRGVDVKRKATDTESGERKKRETNFSIAEKTYLVDLVEARFNIVENKRTDAVSVKQKIKEWKDIAEDFNTQNINVLRTWSTLRSAWDNLKKLVKKLITQDNVNRIGTGGGPPVFFTNVRPEERHLYERVRALIHPVAIGLYNAYDDDVHISSAAHIERDEECEENEHDEHYNQIEESINGDWSSYSSANLRMPRTKVLMKLPLMPVNTNNNEHAEMNLSEILRSEEDVEQITVVEDDSPPRTYVIEIPSEPGPSVSDTTPQRAIPFSQQSKIASKASSATTYPPASKFASSSTDNFHSTRHQSTSRRRPIISQNKNDQFVEVKIKTLSSANEYAAEQHKVIMQIYKEKFKQECLTTKMIEEKLKNLKRKCSAESMSDENDSS